MYRNELLMDVSGDSGIFYLTDGNSLTRSSFPWPPACVQGLLSRRLLRPRGHHPLFTLPQSTFIQSPNLCLPITAMPLPGQPPEPFPWYVTSSDRSPVGLHSQHSRQSGPLPFPPCEEPPVVSRPRRAPLGRSGPKFPVITDLHRLGLSCPNLNVEPEATFLSILCMWPKTLPAAQ